MSKHVIMCINIMLLLYHIFKYFQLFFYFETVETTFLLFDTFSNICI